MKKELTIKMDLAKLCFITNVYNCQKMSAKERTALIDLLSCNELITKHFFFEWVEYEITTLNNLEHIGKCIEWLQTLWLYYRSIYTIINEYACADTEIHNGIEVVDSKTWYMVKRYLKNIEGEY